MSCQHIGFEKGHCLVEIQSESNGPDSSTYTAFMFLVDNEGSVLRPLVARDGHRVRVRAGSEPSALGSAIAYLENRFGRYHESTRAQSFGAASIGRPFTVEG